MLLLRTKFYRPSVPGDLVHRARLYETLNQGLRRPLTLIAAPAGYGKTMLVSSWLETCPYPSAWVSLDESDNDPQVFLSYFLAAVQSVFSGALQRTHLMLASATLPPLGVIAESLIDELDEIEEDFILVLDDAHTINEQSVFDLLAEVLWRPVNSLHVVLITRRDPSLPLANLRAHDRLVEIRLKHLRFSLEETALFVDRVIGSHLRRDAISVLAERSEGWAAGLRLAALTLRYGGDVDRGMAEMHVQNRYVMDFLVSEVLANVPREIEDFLVKTSFLDWLSGPLCDAVMGWEGSARRGQAHLEWLEQANLFTVSLDDHGQWFRYHSLFRRLLSHQLERRLDPGELDSLRLRASAWLAKHGSIDQALTYALASHDTLRAVDLVAQHRHELLNTEQRLRLDRWLRMFSNETVADHPDLLLAKIWIAELSRADPTAILEMLEQVQALLDRKERTKHTQQLEGEVDLLRALEQGFAAGDPNDLIALTTHALATMPTEWYMARSEAWLYLAVAYQFLGDLERSRAVLETARSEDRAEGSAPRMRNTGVRMFVDWMAADLNGLQQAACQLLAVGEATDLYETRGWTHYSLAMAHYQRNDLAAAERHTTAVYELRYACHRISVVQSAIIQAAIHQARGQLDPTQRVLDEAQNYLRETRSEALMPLVQAFAAELAARQGDLELAGRWASTVGPHVPLAAMAFFYAPQLTLPKILLAVNTPTSRRQAAAALDRLHGFVSATHNTRFTIDVLALQALLRDVEGDEPAALAVLEQAVLLAQPGGFVRVFADLGPHMARLFEKMAQKKPVSTYVRQVLESCIAAHLPVQVNPVSRAHPQPPPPGNQTVLADPLTRRELEILDLLAQRYGAKEIAQRLVISDRTVKRHCANIYLKLGTSNRKEAVAVATALGLLPRR